MVCKLFHSETVLGKKSSDKQLFLIYSVEIQNNDLLCGKAGVALDDTGME